MFVNNNQPKMSSFGHLIISKNVTKSIDEKGVSSAFTKKYIDIRNYIENNGLDSKKNVDILLNCLDTEDDKFVAVVSSKKQGPILNKWTNYFVNNDEKSLSGLHRWLDIWDDLYSRKNKK